MILLNIFTNSIILVFFLIYFWLFILNLLDFFIKLFLIFLFFLFGFSLMYSYLLDSEFLL